MKVEIEARALSVVRSTRGRARMKGKTAEVFGLFPRLRSWDNAEDALYCRFGGFPRRSAIH